MESLYRWDFLFVVILFFASNLSNKTICARHVDKHASNIFVSPAKSICLLQKFFHYIFTRWFNCKSGIQMCRKFQLILANIIFWKWKHISLEKWTNKHVMNMQNKFRINVFYFLISEFDFLQALTTLFFFSRNACFASNQQNVVNKLQLCAILTGRLI